MRTHSSEGTLDCRISDILGMDESILSSAIVDNQGRTLASKTKFGAKDIFASEKRGFKDDFGVWTRAVIQMVKPFDAEFGNCNSIVALYDDVKVMIMPVPSARIHFVVVCLRSANAELIICKFNEMLKSQPSEEFVHRGFNDIEK